MDYMLIFDLIFSGVGLYVIYSTIIMKKKGELSSFIINPTEIAKCKDKVAFIGAIYEKLLIFGAVCIVFGILSLINDTVFPMGKYFDFIGVIVFIGALIWFSVHFKKVKEKYFY